MKKRIMEYTTQVHIEHGSLQVNLPAAWDDMDVTVTIAPVASSKSQLSHNLADALEGLIGVCSFEPDNLSEHTSETYAAALARDYDQQQQS